ncbi:MAG: hypothetical protein ABEI53_00105 [Candidatus Magasanikbacteria bacterium]
MNTKKQLAIFTILVPGLYFFGNALNLFEAFSWYDEIIHLIAGIWSALIMIFLYQNKKEEVPFYSYFEKKPLVMIFIIMIGIATSWEIFEKLLVEGLKKRYGAAPDLQPSNFDTITDTIAALLGAWLSYENHRYFT